MTAIDSEILFRFLDENYRAAIRLNIRRYIMIDSMIQYNISQCTNKIILIAQKSFEKKVSLDLYRKVSYSSCTYRNDLYHDLPGIWSTGFTILFALSIVAIGLGQGHYCCGIDSL